ncbi:hypothetical protein BKA63DRAFT_523573 [Paraphoma chrysanthemicola]|nr:hypothetical protein BKA63DRAFT_523573 [Paraphoma chrysanthemicola]
MPTLAIAGGTSPSLGRAIVTALLSPKTKHWDAVIFSRNDRKPLWLRAIDPENTRTRIRTVDYLSVASLASALNGVHTLVSVTSAIDGTQPQIQINLLYAAVQAGCKRFAPAEWGFGPKAWGAAEPAGMGFSEVWTECVKAQDKIECARFNQGAFMNYIGLGMYPDQQEIDQDQALQQMTNNGGYAQGEDQVCQGLQRQGDLNDGSGAFLVGLKNAIAELPQKDDGSWPRITMTSMIDVGRLFVASLDLPHWEEEMNIAGDTVTMGELLEHVEAVTGRKFEVDILNQAEIEARKAALAPDDFMGQLFAELKLSYVRDEDDGVVLRPVVNHLLPDVRTTSVREYIEECWRTANQSSAM